MIPRNYYYIDKYLNELMQDIYVQPWDVGHDAWAREVVFQWGDEINPESILDVWAGEGFCQDIFKEIGIENYVGVAIGDDVITARKLGRNVFNEDFHFLPYAAESFDMVFARHSLEHSPMPLLALMEWHRVAKYWLCLILPNPEFWTYTGRNHYSVLQSEQAEFLLNRAGWNVIWKEHTNEELRFMC